VLDVEDVAMKPTCPTACPLKQKIEEHKRGEAQTDELKWIFDQATPFERYRLLAVANFMYYQHKGLTKFSTWIEMLERQRVLFFIWGSFERLSFRISTGR
jgi:hypothetical protein